MGYSKGDVVTCVRQDCAKVLNLGKYYVVTETMGADLRVKGLEHWRFSERYFGSLPKVPVYSKGDKVKCVNEDWRKALHVGEVYTVAGQSADGDVSLVGVDGFFHPGVFEMVEEHLPHPPEQLKYFYVHAGSDNNGGSTDYYKLPEGAKDLQDLIEHKAMSFSQGNIFKAAYRLHDKCPGKPPVRDIHKIIWFAQRMLNEINTPST